MDTPEHILKIIRQRIGLNENYTGSDAEIDAMTPINKLRHLVGWELGDEEWADEILRMAEECGLQITDV